MRRRLNSASIVTVAAVVARGGGRAARIALGGVGRTPVRAPRPRRCSPAGPLTARRRGRRPRRADDAAPFNDAYASAWYRARVLPVHLRRALIGE